MVPLPAGSFLRRPCAWGAVVVRRAGGSTPSASCPAAATSCLGATPAWCGAAYGWPVERPWSWEGIVQDALARWLATDGWTVRATADTETKAPGIDLLATSGDRAVPRHRCADQC